MRFLVVDEEPIVRWGTAELIRHHLAAATVGEAGSVVAALTALASEPWDLIVLDLALEGRRGFELLQEAARRWPQVRSLVVTACVDAGATVRAFRLGADGFCTKAQPVAEVVEALRLVAGGHRYVTPEAAEHLAAAVGREHHDLPHEALSARELQTLCLVAKGMTTKQVAMALTVSPKTVATYRARIAVKTGLATRLELAGYAIRNGLAG